MTEAVTAPQSSSPAGGSPQTASAVPPGAASASPPPAGDPSASPPAAKPEWVPDTAWDPATGALKVDALGEYVSAQATLAKAEQDRRAAIPAKPEDYKLEIKLPETVKVPDELVGKIKVDDKDPRLPMLRQVAHQHGLTPDTVNALLAIDAQAKIAAHVAETQRVRDEHKKLGANAQTRINAVGDWLKGLKARSVISATEHDALAEVATSAEAVSALEKIIAKASGAVPGADAGTPPSPDPGRPKSLAERLYPHGAFNPNPQARAS